MGKADFCYNFFIEMVQNVGNVFGTCCVKKKILTYSKKDANRKLHFIFPTILFYFLPSVNNVFFKKETKVKFMLHII